MAESSGTPGSALDDEAYKEYVVQKYGQIRGLVKTLLMFRKSNARQDDDPVKKTAARDFARGDIANYRRIRMELEKARKLLNRLHLQVIYAEKNRDFEDIPYTDIQASIEGICGILNDMDRDYVEPSLERQREALMLDYMDF